MNAIFKKTVAVAMTFVVLSITPLCDVAPKAVESGLPTVARAAEDESGGKYIKEVRVGMGETEDEAKKELEADGFTILKDSSGKYADLNQGAGSKSIFKKGANERIVYLGYKTTSDPKQAITDLAVMNMGTKDNTPYSIEDYNVLMDKAMETQIKPFVDRFIATLEEYRTNCGKPKNTLNYIRANYMRQMLNKLTDDDTGKPLGDLLINKTKYEMGDAAYNALSDTEKKDHADILTILMQANGKATLAMEILLTRATDTSDENWIDRFTSTSLEDLEEQIKQDDPNTKSLADMHAALDRKYHDTAVKLLKKWEQFRGEIIEYEDKALAVEDASGEIEEKIDELEDIDADDISKEDIETIAETNKEVNRYAYDKQIAQIGSHLDSVNYGEGTLLDFFSREYEDVSSDEGIRSFYPMVESLTPGQIAGLEFLSFADLISMAMTDEDAYGSIQESMEAIESASIYEGVERDIYEKGGVAMTSDALRSQAADVEPEDYSVGTLQLVLWGAFAISFGTAVSIYAKYLTSYSEVVSGMSEEGLLETANVYAVKFGGGSIAKALLAGTSVLAVVLFGVSIAMTVLDLQNYYKTTFLPIPNIMVDKADITDTDASGKEIMKKNQTAYYRAVRCNRREGNDDISKENFQILGDKADLNGDIGRQWLALYAVRYEGGKPILADSLMYTKDTDKLPDGYKTGIHQFGNSSACNLNKKAYLYPDNPPKIYVYYKTADKSTNELLNTASVFSSGSLAVTGALGMVFGAMLAVLALGHRKKFTVETESEAE